MATAAAIKQTSAIPVAATTATAFIARAEHRHHQQSPVPTSLWLSQTQPPTPSTAQPRSPVPVGTVVVIIAAVIMNTSIIAKPVANLTRCDPGHVFYPLSFLICKTRVTVVPTSQDRRESPVLRTASGAC